MVVHNLQMRRWHYQNCTKLRGRGKPRTRETSDSTDQQDCGSLNSSCAMPCGLGMLSEGKQDKLGLTQCDFCPSNFCLQGFQRVIIIFPLLYSCFLWKD